MNLTNTLADLAERIREAAEAVAVAERTAAEQALEAGRLLCQAKQECRHGEWIPFLNRAGVGERQAQRLMQIARSGLKPDTVSDLGGIKATLAYLAKLAPPTAGHVLMIGRVGWTDHAEYEPFAMVQPAGTPDSFYVSAIDLRDRQDTPSSIAVFQRGASAMPKPMPDGSFIVPLWAAVDHVLRDIAHAEREFMTVKCGEGEGEFGDFFYKLFRPVPARSRAA